MKKTFSPIIFLILGLVFLSACDSANSQGRAAPPQVSQVNINFSGTTRNPAGTGSPGATGPGTGSSEGTPSGSESGTGTGSGGTSNTGNSGGGSGGGNSSGTPNGTGTGNTTVSLNDVFLARNPRNRLSFEPFNFGIIPDIYEPLPVTRLQLPQVVAPLFRDSTYNTPIVRITDEVQRGGFGTHDYSQLQFFSKNDQEVLLIESGHYVVRRWRDLRLMMMAGEWNDIRWHPVLLHTLVHFDTNADDRVRIQFTNVVTQTTQDVYTFPPEYLRVAGNQSHDALSRDGRWITGMLRRNDGAPVIFTVDLHNQALSAVISVSNLYQNGTCTPDPRWGVIEPDWIAASPSGRYLVVQWPSNGTSHCNGLEIFDIQAGTFIAQNNANLNHGDLGIAADGITDVFVSVDYPHPDDINKAGVVMRELPSSPSYYLDKIDWNFNHVSCQGPPGVCLVTTRLGVYEDPVTHQWVVQTPDNPNSTYAAGSLFLQFLSRDRTSNRPSIRLAHHFSSECVSPSGVRLGDGYWVSPRASLSQSGRFAVFASDWGSRLGCNPNSPTLGNGQGEAFGMDLQSIRY